MAPTEDSPMGKRLNYCPKIYCPKIESAKPHKRRYSDYSGLPGIWHPQKLKPQGESARAGIVFLSFSVVQRRRAVSSWAPRCHRQLTTERQSKPLPHHPVAHDSTLTSSAALRPNMTAMANAAIASIMARTMLGASRALIAYPQ